MPALRRPRRPARAAPYQFPAYREFVRDLEAANAAVGTLDVAAELALQQLAGTTQQTRLLSSIFPTLAPRRFRTTGVGFGQTLADAGGALATMAVPYAFTSYERYVKQVLLICRRWNHCQLTENTISHLGLDDLGTALGDSGIRLPAQDLRLIDFARKIRNRVVHASGTVGDLRREYLALSSADRTEWEWNAGRSFLRAIAGGRLGLAPGEALAVIAITRRLAHAINVSVQVVLSQAEWLDVAFRDYAATHSGHSNDLATFENAVRGYVHHAYASVALPAGSIRAHAQPHVERRLERRNAQRRRRRRTP